MRCAAPILVVFGGCVGILGSHEAGDVDAARRDTAAADAGEIDAGVLDAALSDARTIDTEATDAVFEVRDDGAADVIELADVPDAPDARDAVGAIDALDAADAVDAVDALDAVDAVDAVDAPRDAATTLDGSADATSVMDSPPPSPTYHVNVSHASASDTNAGTEAAPWRTITHAATVLRAGETVLIHRGTYAGDVAPQASGTAAAPITYRAAPSDERLVIIEGVFRIIGRSHIRVEGLRVQHGSEGFEIRGPSSHIVISGNHTYDTRGSGILAHGVPWGEDPGRFAWRGITDLLIENNEIELACNGGYNENITIMNGAEDVEIRGNHLFRPGDTTYGGEGIDLKEGVARARIHHNHVDALGRIGIYLDAAGRNTAFAAPLLTDIEVYNNVVHDSPMGIGMTSEGTGSIDGVRIYNNVVYRNQRDGIGLYGHPEESPTNFMRNILVYNNTTYANSIEEGRPWWGGIHLTHARLSGAIVRNNIAWGNAGAQLMNDPSVIEDHNVTDDPEFVDAASGDFHLRASSPAVDTGTATLAAAYDADDVARPVGPSVDVGAYERTR